MDPSSLGVMLDVAVTGVFCAELAEECVADPGSKGADESLDLLYVIQLIMHPLDCCHHHI